MIAAVKASRTLYLKAMNCIKKRITMTHFSNNILLCLSSALMIIMVICCAMQASAATKYLPDVTPDMSRPSYWTSKDAAPDEVLVTPEEIKKVNQDIIDGKGTGVWDIASWTTDTFNGISRGKALKEAAMEDAEYCFSQGAKYLNGNKLSQTEAMDQLYGPMIDNCVDPEAAASMPVGYAICTSITTLRTFPTDVPLQDDPDDPDFDYLYLSEVNVGDPLIIRGRSADGKYYCASSSYQGGWIPASDIAFCKDRNEWLDAWNYDDKQALVVYDDKIMTEDSNYAPETANRKLLMGTRLQIADRKDWEGKINNRYAYNNYVVWMPVRLADGSFKNQLALISEHCKVNEGFLPLTTNNLAKVIFNQLGNTYGWGGMLSSHDCSGYVRAVYLCFGINMGRNTTNQAVQPVKKYSLTGKTGAEKNEIIKSLPLGAELLFNGHAMIYLGHEGDKLYVISAVSNLVTDNVKYRVRGAVINTLDIKRPNGSSWLSNLHTAAIPYYNASSKDLSKASVEALDEMTYTGKELTPSPKVTLNGSILKEHVHYTVSYESNKDTGSGVVIITGKGNYSGTIKKTFPIRAAKKTIQVTLSKDKVVYNGKVRTPAVTVKQGGKELDPSFYAVSWQGGRTKPGIYKVTVRLKNGYEGTASAAFRILPKGTEISRLKKGRKAFRVSWKKQALKMPSRTITGYQVQYATNKKLTTGKETVTVRNRKKTSLKINQLRKNKKYYVRIRTYIKVGGKNFFSPWSKVKTVVTR